MVFFYSTLALVTQSLWRRKQKKKNSSNQKITDIVLKSKYFSWLDEGNFSEKLGV